VTTSRLDTNEAEFFRSPFISLCLMVGPAVGFVALIGYERLLNSPAYKALPVSVLADGTAWFWAYLLGLQIAVPAVVIFVVIGLVFKCAGFLSALVSAALPPIILAGFFYFQGGMRMSIERALTGSLRLLIPSVAAMTACWLLAGAIRTLRATR
jgi:hypothetical protein